MAFFKSLSKSWMGAIGFGLVAIFVLAAIFAELIAPFDPAAQDLRMRMLPPIWQEGGNIAHLLGTDQLGRDTLSRLIFGSRISLTVALAGTLLAAIIGIVLGAVAGYYSRLADTIIGRVIDIQLAFPFILLAIFVVAVLGPGLVNIILVAALTGWVRFARVVRGEILSIKQLEYIEAVRSLGGRDARIVFRHILPNILSPIVVIGTLEVAKIILMEASLSFLGMGVPPDVPTWGRMLSESREYMQTAPQLVILPGIVISLLVLGISIFGDWLRDYLDPRIKTN